jgi:hypothetical protein
MMRRRMRMMMISPRKKLEQERLEDLTLHSPR